MPDRNWLRYAPLGLAVALYLFWLGAAVAPVIPRIEYHPASYQSESERNDARDQADAEAQIWMAYAAWAQVGVGVLGLFGLGVTIYFARNAWWESRRSADEAKRQADVAEREHREGSRGHLFATIEQSTIEFTGTRGDIPQVDFTLKNIGQRHVIVRVARYGLIQRARGAPLAEFAENMRNSMTALQPVLIEPGQEVKFDGTVFRSGGWLTEDNWPGFWGTKVYFQILIFYTDHLEMLREHSVTWDCYCPNDEWEGMFLYERGYDRQVGQVNPNR